MKLPKTKVRMPDGTLAHNFQTANFIIIIVLFFVFYGCDIKVTHRLSVCERHACVIYDTISLKAKTLRFV